MHPFYIVTNFWSVCTNCYPDNSSASIFSSAISLTIKAHLRPSLFLRICYRRVVFPDPKNPDSKVTGNLTGNLVSSWSLCYPAAIF